MNAIYKIENTINGKFLIGSTNNPKERWKRHKCSARHNKHPNRYFQNEWNKYKESAFKFIIIQEVIKEQDLLLCEQKWIDKYLNTGLLLNLNFITNKPPGFDGRVHSKKTKTKMSIVKQGTKNPFFGKTHTLKQRNKWRTHRVGKNASNYKGQIFTLISPENEKVICEGIYSTAKTYNLIGSKIYALLKGTRKSHRGWRAHGE